jgi:hypothetical protein
VESRVWVGVAAGTLAASTTCSPRAFRRTAFSSVPYKPFVTSGLGADEEQGELSLGALRGSLVEKSKN